MVIAGFAVPSPGLSFAGPGGSSTATGRFRSLGGPATPLSLIVPSIRLHAPIVPIDYEQIGEDLVLKPPSDVHEVGWWRRSAKPGSPDGQTLITGHTVHTGGGVMNELGNLRPGAVIQVETKLGLVEYRATKIFVYTRAELSENADELFGQTRKQNRLVLVTCTGWTGSEYTSNIIVFAQPLGVLKSGESPTPEPGKSPTTKPGTKSTTKPGKSPSVPSDVQPAA